MARPRAGVEAWLTPRNLDVIRSWARAGHALGAIASLMHVSPATLRAWRVRHPEIREALSEGGAVAVAEVEAALLRRAVGYTVPVVREEESSSGDTRVVTTARHIPGSVEAQKFYLKNRAPEAWSDTTRLDVLHVQADQIVSILDTVVAGLGLDPTERARVPELVTAAIAAQQLVVEGQVVEPDIL